MYNRAHVVLFFARIHIWKQNKFQFVGGILSKQGKQFKKEKYYHIRLSFHMFNNHILQ